MERGNGRLQVPFHQSREESRVAPFTLHHRHYDEWFDRHREAYLSELLEVRALLPWAGRGAFVAVRASLQ